YKRMLFRSYRASCPSWLTVQRLTRTDPRPDGTRKIACGRDLSQSIRHDLGDRIAGNLLVLAQPCGGAASGLTPHGERADWDRFSRRSTAHRLSQSAFGVLVLRGDDEGHPGQRFTQRSHVDGLDAVEIDHANGHSAGTEALVSRQRFVNRS